MVGSVGVTLLIAILVARSVPEPRESGRTSGGAMVGGTDGRGGAGSVTSPGVQVRLTSGDVTVTRTLPAMSFALERGASLDPRIPAGPFTATLVVTFDPGATRRGRIGAQIMGGKLTVRRGGPGGEILHVDATGAEPRLSLSSPAMPVTLSRQRQTLTYRFEATADGPVAFRAVWQPEDSLVPLPLPADGAPLVEDAALRGLVLAQEMRCVRCHDTSSETLRAQLDPGPAPILGDVGARVRPDWLRRWLRDPHEVKPGTAMPGLAHGNGLGDESIEDLTHFLVSMGGPIDVSGDAPSAAYVATGMIAYHRVGCFACHGPLVPLQELPGGLKSIGKPRLSYAPLGPLAEKTTVDRLAAFLRDPVAVRPSGVMPGMRLSEVESEAIASYLVDHTGPLPPPEAFTLDAACVERGKKFFGAVGCADCHDLGPDRTAIASTLAAPALESLAGDPGDAGSGFASVGAAAGAGGCLDRDPPAGAPDFDLAPGERDDLRAFLGSLAGRRNDDVPLDALVATIVRLDCTACHSYHSDLGPEAATRAYFGTEGDADLGDEGRLPPDLTAAGARLTTAWMHDVLVGGERARPYLAARMPEYGERAVGALPDLLAAAAGANSLLDADPEFSIEAATLGRELVGDSAFNCIQCHEIAGHPSTGTPGPDLALMPGRLRPEAFSQWLHDPDRIRPGTRMPTFFVAGRSAQTGIFGGDAQKQIDAVWSYLSQGESLAPPPGLVDPGGFELVVEDEPVVFRSFMATAGVRAIACGYPEQVHCAFDADRCQVTAVWTGRFLSAQGAWGARGGSETNPDTPAWTAPGAPLLTPLAGGDDPRPAPVFLGYRLDPERRPIFHYRIGAIDVHEKPEPSGGGGMRLAFRFEGPPGARIMIRPGGLTVGGSDITVGDAAAPDDRVLTLDTEGHGALVLEVTW